MVEEEEDMLVWTYDLGDGWIHLIKVLEIIGPDKSTHEVEVLGGQNAV